MLTPKRTARYRRDPVHPLRCRGFTMIEVLATLAIVLIGLLGVFGLQVKAANVELESYQRSQALALVQDMSIKLSNSRAQVAAFNADTVSSTDGSLYVGTMTHRDKVTLAPVTVTDPCAGISRTDAAALSQLCAWGDLVRGAAAKEGVTEVGAMIGARGCLIRVEPPQQNALADIYVVVVWQGISSGNEPLDDAVTGKNGCAGDLFDTGLRRGVSARVMVPDLKKAS